MLPYPFLVVFLALGAVMASPPESLSQTYCANQQRTNYIPRKSLTSIQNVTYTGSKALTTPTYADSSNSKIWTNFRTNGVDVSASCAFSDGQQSYSQNFPDPTVTAVGSFVSSSDGRSYVVVRGTSSFSYLYAFGHACNYLFGARISSIGTFSPIVLPDNSIVYASGYQLIMLANASNPILGLTLWRYNLTTDSNALPLGMAMSSDSSSGLFYVVFRAYNRATHSEYENVMQALKVSSSYGFSPVWSIKLGSNFPSSWSSMGQMGSTEPVVCGDIVLFRTFMEIFAVNAVSGSLSWFYNTTLSGNRLFSNQPACHPNGYIFFTNGIETVYCLHHNGTNVELRWKRETGVLLPVRNPVTDLNGNVYLVAGASSPSDPNPGYLMGWNINGDLLFPPEKLNSKNDYSTSTSFSSQININNNGIEIGLSGLFKIY